MRSVTYQPIVNNHVLARQLLLGKISDTLRETRALLLLLDQSGEYDSHVGKIISNIHRHNVVVDGNITLAA